jgi:prepilin-type N-terminal cleavage/methylation domain-containing protein
MPDSMQIRRTSHRRTRQSYPLRGRSGFTLIELLVAVSIILVLAVITIRLVNTSLDSDRLKTGSREVQSYLAGARDRAIYASNPRGVRFIPDPNDPYSIRSFVYIGAPTNFTDGQQLTLTAGTTTISPSGPTATIFGTLASRGLLLPGAQITLGGSAISGAYYSMAPNPVSTAPFWVASTIYPSGSLVQPATANGHSYVSTTAGTSGGGPPSWPTGTGATVTDNTVVWTEFSWTLTKNYSGISPQPYTVQLAPVPLPSEQPRTLPRNIVIDLRTSVLPQNWPGPPTAASTFDVLFSPSGTVIGPLAAAGRLHLVLADVADTAGSALTSALATPAYNRYQLNAPWLPGTQYAPGNIVVPTPSSFIAYRCTTGGTSAASAPTQFATPTPNQTFTDGGVTWQSFVKKSNLIMSLATATGRVTTHPVDVSTPAPPFQYGTPAVTITGYDSFRFAETGEVTQ